LVIITIRRRDLNAVAMDSIGLPGSSAPVTAQQQDCVAECGFLWSLECIGIVVRGVRWLGVATSDGRSVSGSQAPTQTACHGTLFSLTTILIHSPAAGVDPRCRRVRRPAGRK